MTATNYIDGAWVDGAETIKSINPSNWNDCVGEFALATHTEVEQAGAAAANAFLQWSHTGIQTRHDILKKVGDLILEKANELGDLLAREEGKTKAEGIGEVIRAAQIFHFFAGECLRLSGEVLPSTRPSLTVEITREPIGVVGLITPWNFPIAIPAWKIAPALAYGNCVVFKPSEEVPALAYELVRILEQAGVPKGVVNLVVGTGSEVGQALVENEHIQAISFTGSRAVGQHIAEQCVKLGKKFQLEMGGKNPLVVLDDADVDNAVECAINGAFYSTGQRCTASSRLIVTAGIYDLFLSKLIERMKALVVGDARDSQTHIGPLANKAQLNKTKEYLALGQSEGAQLIIGGEDLSEELHGYFIRPVLFANVTPSMRIAQEEVFGPFATLHKVADFDEALALANATDFGLAAGICTSSLYYAQEFKRRSEVGMVMVNVPTAGVDYHVPFGGRKDSSYGPREQGRYAEEFYTTVKTAYIKAL
ncbi:Aldehyde dehydrogenase, thermostable [Oligella ureolytica]|uniref:aldehyde dehydrogenase family protein n=1 Tax=Oligella ureolytica TaxID=90244 RepID=UPI000DFBCF78|nr:aldehyde dehydrogenase family protein [Oligella ureolytica]SUA55264.1 Aldehyde dehydrogenase, thermostable [Oligella ureolytica]